jgi:hypothetical protein
MDTQEAMEVVLVAFSNIIGGYNILQKLCVATDDIDIIMVSHCIQE